MLWGLIHNARGDFWYHFYPPRFDALLPSSGRNLGSSVIRYATRLAVTGYLVLPPQTGGQTRRTFDHCSAGSARPRREK